MRTSADVAAAIHADLVSLAPGDGPRVPPRSYLRSDAPSLDLTGTWDFRWFPSTGALIDALSDDAQPADGSPAWERIEVPSHWVLTEDHRWGSPAYTNIDFPFPVDPPQVPEENPAGLYRRTLTVGDDLLPDGFVAAGGRLYLRTLGVESLAVVHLNGERVGAIRGSRLAQELDVTEHLRPGENELLIRVHQFSAATYLEDQDQWWLPGVFREVELLARPAGRVDDAWLRGDYDPATGEGALIAEVRAPEAAWPITIRIPALGIEASADSPEDLGPIPVGPVDPWSPDAPTLYEAEVIGRGETVRLPVGFRRVEIVGHEWRVNGRKLRLRGVNRHEYHPQLGRVFDEEDAWAQLLLMKRHNINAIRTSHYPPHPRLLEMTDELGFWVIDEGDLETHGFEAQGWRDNPLDDPRWREALVDRAQRLLERDKNHPSVICWSLGNESHTGRGAEAMAAWIRRRDPERPVHYEPDFDGRYTDIVSRMYEPIESMQQMSAGVGQGQARSAGRNAVLAGRPMIQCEYAHAMGNGPGALQEHEEAFSTLPQWHGGFVWEWRDHGLLTTAADGAAFHAYGGDFGEPLHDSSFVCDGLVLSDGRPSPALGELKAVITPIRLEIVDGERLRVVNLRHGADTSDLRFVAVREADGRPVGQADLVVPPLGPGEEALVDLPWDLRDTGTDSGPLRELWLTIRAELAEAAVWAPAGHEISSVQLRLADRTAATPCIADEARPEDQRSDDAQPVGPAEERDGEIVLGGARFEARTGILTSIDGVPVRGPRLTLWRAPIENDRLAAFGSYLEADPAQTLGAGAPGPSTAQTWRQRNLHLLQRRTLAVQLREERAGAVLVVRERWAPPALPHAVDVELHWRWRRGGLQVEAEAAPSADWTGTWGRIGLAIELAPGAQSVAWFGTGPEENYPDSRAAARVGRYERPLAEMVCDYAVPQESGHREGLRELVIRGVGDGSADGGASLRVVALPVAGSLPGFSVRAHDEREVAAAAHPHELPASRATHLFLDAAQHGLGSRSCGPDVLPAYQLRPRAAGWSLRLHVEREVAAG